jgi:ssDNA-binding Zn-finger/Zn-ribbon topoisomerase 1
MIERDGKYGKYEKFLGCTNYPKCRHTLQINENNIVTIDDVF